MLGKYLGCTICGCKFVSKVHQFDTNCPVCFSSVVILSEIQSQDVLEVLKKHGEIYPKYEESPTIWEQDYSIFDAY